MAEHKKLSMLVKLDDGQTYTLGGDGADNAVTLDTEQTITGLKTFDKLPQSSVEPKADADLITKGYADGHYLPVDTKPHKYDILVKMKHDGTSWVGFSDFSVRLRDGTRLDIKHIENQSATTATKPVKAVFKTVKDLKAPIEAPKQQAATFFDTYDLEAGEFTGTVSFYKVVGKFGPAQNDINPWYVYVGNGNANNYDGIYAVSIDNLDKPLLGVNLKFGDAHNGYTYTCTQCGVVFTVDGSALEVAYDGDMANGVETTIEYPINAQSMIGVVKVDNAQEITGAKTFTQNVTVTAKPKEATDVATVGYVSGLLNAKAPYDVTLDFKVEDDTDGGWVVYSNMEINLDNGKKLKCIHIDNTSPTSASAPAKAVFKPIPATEAINAAPTEQAPTFFDTYQLQDEEYLGTLTYGHILNSQLQDYASYKGPFHTNQYGTTCTIKEATQLRISISELPAAVSKVSLQFSSSYLPKTFKASLSGVGMDVTSNVLTNPSGNTPLELLFDVVKLTGLVTLDTAQTITGAKTFEKLPKSEATPKDDADLITKAYLDAALGSLSEIPDVPVKHTEVLMRVMQDNANAAWACFNHMKFFTRSGKTVQPLYIENTDPNKADTPIQVVYTLADSSASGTYQDKSFFDSYSLKAGEFKGTITFSKLCDANWETHTTSTYWNPYNIYAAYDKTDVDEVRDYLKFTFEKLPSMLGKVEFTNGDPNNQNGYVFKEVGFVVTADAYAFTSKMLTKGDDHLDRGSTHTVEFEYKEASGPLPANLVTLDTEQEITALKTFKVLPQSEAVPADDKDLVNKKYVDEKVGAGGGTGGAAPANMVTTDTAQNITEVKTFDKLPKSSVEPADDTELVNKKYVDSKTGSAGANVVTTDTEQTITAVKTFEKLPKSDAVPADANELVNKKYVDSVCPQPLQGYEVTLYAIAKTGNSYVGINGLTLFFGNGQKLVPAIIEGANDYSFAPSDARIIWTLDTSVVAKQVTKTDIDQHVLADGEIDGRIQASYTLGGKFTNNKYDQFFMGGQMRLGSAGVTDEQPFVKLIVKGPIAPITKITLTSDYEADKIPASVRATVCQIGGEIKESKPVSITAIKQNVELTLEKTFEPDSYYVNRFDDQDVLGVKKFGSVPTIKKNNALYGIGRSDTPALFGDLSGSIALPVPQKQMFNISFGTKTTQNGVGSNATYTHVTTAVVGALKLKIRRPNDLVEEELYLKAHGPSTNGYRGILTNKKPSNYPNQIEVMDQSTMDGYKLKAGEYFTKLAFNSSTSENAWQDKLLEQAEKTGSNMLPKVFAASASTFFTNTTTNKFGNSPASVAFRLFIYDCPMITSWAYDDQSANKGGASISLYSGDGSRNKGYTQENILNNHFAKDIPELNMQTTNVLAAIAALEARIKALEDAAPKPQYKLIVVILQQRRLLVLKLHKSYIGVLKTKKA